jgi:hypothetical protein
MIGMTNASTTRIIYYLWNKTLSSANNGKKTRDRKRGQVHYALKVLMIPFFCNNLFTTVRSPPNYSHASNIERARQSSVKLRSQILTCSVVIVSCGSRHPLWSAAGRTFRLCELLFGDVLLWMDLIVQEVGSDLRRVVDFQLRHERKKSTGNADRHSNEPIKYNGLINRI